MNLWLIPASDDAADANVTKTLAVPISSERAKTAGVEVGIRAWGAKASSDANVNKFKKMSQGDYCLFYTKGRGGGSKRYCWKGVISSTIQSPEIAKALWDDSGFELVYFLKDVVPIDITPERISSGFAEFRPNYFSDAPKGFTTVDPDVVKGILEKYGSLDSWLASLSRGMRFWVEKTLVTGRPDRQSGEHALGRALWSPQRAEGGRDIYRLMREVQPGDAVFHFIDNQELDSYSIVSGGLDESFTGLAGTDWADRPAYRIQLRDNTKILPPIPREAFLGETSAYRPLISNLLASETGLFFNREFNLNQGSYLTAAPLELVQIWNDIHLKQTGQPLNPDWNIPSLDSQAASQKTYWIFQGNPDHFDIDRYISNRQEITWSVRQYVDRLRAGDEVLLWRSGAGGGVIARCAALSSADASITEDAPELWKTQSERDSTDRKCRLHVIEKYIQQPIPRDRIRAALPELPIFRFAQNTNYPISESDYRKILQMKAHDASRVDFTKFTDVEDVISRCGLRTPPNFLRRLIASLAAKPFVILTGTSGTGKTKIAQAIALWLTSDRKAYRLIPVGADWTGNDNVIGYPDGLDQNLYVGKPALELTSRFRESL
jgi:predicted RNA-binding protein with PUA-like domain